MVRPARFERAAFGFGGQRSIQLSYGRLSLRSIEDCKLNIAKWKPPGAPTILNFQSLICNNFSFTGAPGSIFAARRSKTCCQLVRPAGVEPAACGFEVRRSIQLSYGRKQIADCRLRNAGTDTQEDPQSEIRNPQQKNWGERRGLNPRPPGPQPGALPTELRPP